VEKGKQSRRFHTSYSPWWRAGRKARWFRFWIWSGQNNILYILHHLLN